MVVAEVYVVQLETPMGNVFLNQMLILIYVYRLLKVYELGGG